MNYDDFLQSKLPRVEACGIEPGFINTVLFDWQAKIAEIAVKRGRFAGFEDCGLGKTLQQVEWCRQYLDHKSKGLIVAPLSVAQQTIKEAQKLNVEIQFVSEPKDEKGIQITNYQKLHKFVGFKYDFICLDESSILKSLDGKTRTLLLEQFTHIPYRSAWTATPSPNDVVELLQHSEFLGVKSAREAKSEFFVHDSKNGASNGYRLKGHAVKAFWEWVAEWAIYMRRPSDLGYSDDRFILPDLNIREEIVRSNFIPDGQLFPDLMKGITGRAQTRKHSLDVRVEAAAEIINGLNEQWLVWCDLNDEGRNLVKLLKASERKNGAVLLEGATSDDDRVLLESTWRRGDVKTFIGKTGMFGHGLNWQHCHNILYLGLGDSYEKWYQSVRRCYRFGQKCSVNVVIVTSDAEMSIVDNVRRKEQQAAELAEGIVNAMKEKQVEKIARKKKQNRESIALNTDVQKSADLDGKWTMVNQDCVQGVKILPSDFIGLSLFSPPFAKLYCYSDSPADMGNCKNDEEFFEQFNYLIPELLRVTMPGRLCVVHCQDLSTSKVNDGFIGRRRFSDMIADSFEEHGWIFASRVTIDKDPQIQAVRTKAKTLMFVQKNKDSSWSWPALGDYLMVFQKPGVNPFPVITDISNEEWIKLAHPVWYDIRESDTLNARAAREEKDEAHLCPLQLGTIRNAIRLWSSRDDLVLSPFAGIGSEGVVALEQERRFIGFELKESYWKQAVKNLKVAIKQQSLFMEAGN